MTIAAILKHKGYDVATVRPDLPVADVTRLLAGRRIGAVVVQGEGEALLGILSERDIVSCLAAHGARALELTAGQLMTRDVRTATPDTTVDKAMSIMTEGRFRHLPVLEHGMLHGIVSIGDVVKARINQQDCEVDSLKAYVAGSA
jgi:CBS domain-containing protein